MTDTLESLRDEIDTIDSQIIELLESRMGVTDRVAVWKEKNNVSTTQSGREEAMFARFRSHITHRILRDNIVQIYQQILHASKASQMLSRAPHIPITRIGFVGLGLIGGSIAKAVSCAYPDIELSVYKHRSGADFAGTVCTNIFDNLEEFAMHNDLIIIAAPVDATENIAGEIAKAVHGRRTKLIVIDTASTKNHIAQSLSTLCSGKADFIPTHPMAGSEKEGYENAKPDLFIHQPWIITPLPENSESSLEIVKSFTTGLGSQVYTLSPEEHDKTVASCSHLVFVMAAYLFHYVSDREFLRYAGSGFTSATRTASGNVAMHSQIFQVNTQNILNEMKEFVTYIQNHPLKPETIQSFFTQAKEKRDSWKLTGTK